MNKIRDLNKLPKYHSEPIQVSLLRGSIIESIHKVHAVVCDNKGRVLMAAGNPEYESFIRSSLKPFQAIPFLSSGTAERIGATDKEIAIACSSHCGSTAHARQAFKILWNADIQVNELQCPTPIGKSSPLEHNCSGKHASFLATCKKMGWPKESYLNPSHPLQKEIMRRVGEILEIPGDELIEERDDCGAPTLKLRISQMAILFAHLISSENNHLEQISRSMLSNPDLIAGPGYFDSELTKRAHGQLISKGGAEGIQCIGRCGEGIGIAIKVEDGSKRAKHAVALSILKQLDWITPTALQELELELLAINSNVKLRVNGQLEFLENSINHE